MTRGLEALGYRKFNKFPICPTHKKYELNALDIKEKIKSFKEIEKEISEKS